MDVAVAGGAGVAVAGDVGVSVGVGAAVGGTCVAVGGAVVGVAAGVMQAPNASVEIRMMAARAKARLYPTIRTSQQLLEARMPAV